MGHSLVNIFHFVKIIDLFQVQKMFLIKGCAAFTQKDAFSIRFTGTHQSI